MKPYTIDPTTYEHCRSHFITRLKERYDIDLTESEYDELKGNSENLYKLSALKNFVLIKIKDKHVFCIRKSAENRDKLGGKWAGVRVPTRLVTCLSPGSRMPVPLSLKRKGYDSEKFEQEINDAIKKVIELEYELQRVGYKDFFMKNNANRDLKRAAHSWHRDGHIHIDTLIRHLHYKIIEGSIFSLMKE